MLAGLYVLTNIRAWNTGPVIITAKCEVLEKVVMVYFVMIKVRNVTAFQVFFRKIVDF